MIRRLVAALSVVALVPFAIHGSPASASPVSNSTPEKVARIMVAASPQISGPRGGALSWGLNRIDQRTIALTSAASYDFSEDGGGVTAYVLDSGVNASHPEFGGRVKDGWSYRGSATSLDSYRTALADFAIDPNTGIEPCANDGTHSVNPTTFDSPATVDTSDKGKTDNNGHGTHVAGIIGGETTGVAKNVSIVPVRGLDSCGSGTTTMISDALEWILAHHQVGERAVLNLSIGFSGQVIEVDNLITAIMDEGVVVAAAAGNDAMSACGNTPASTSGTISVGATSSQDREASYSNYGTCVDIFAPGSAIDSTYPFLSGITNTYETLYGTSMAAPFISGAVARFLQVLDEGPTNFVTGPTAAWTWLRNNTTLSAITYYSNVRPSQTPNRLLYVPATSVRVQQLAAASIDSGAVVSWQNAQSGTTYTATATPGNAKCSAVGAGSCTITGLVNGTSYIISTIASNVNGKGAASTTVTPQSPPIAPTAMTASVASKAVTLSWTAVTNNLPVTYVVTSSNGTTVCTTTTTTCTVVGLVNGTEYSFLVTSQTSVGTSPSATKVVARPGFTVVKTAVAKRSRTLLSSLVKTISNGRKSWSETGTCSIRSSRLVAPTKSTTCKLTLKVAKTSKYPAMSTKVTITVK